MSQIKVIYKAASTNRFIDFLYLFQSWVDFRFVTLQYFLVLLYLFLVLP